jgi:hypothetical protein
MSPEARENQLISLAVDCAERQMREGTASAAVIVHYLKLGTEKERLEREKLKAENQLLQAKTQAIEDAKNEQELYINAIAAMKRYGGHAEE